MEKLSINDALKSLLYLGYIDMFYGITPDKLDKFRKHGIEELGWSQEEIEAFDNLIALYEDLKSFDTTWQAQINYENARMINGDFGENKCLTN